MHPPTQHNSLNIVAIATSILVMSLLPPARTIKTGPEQPINLFVQHRSTNRPVDAGIGRMSSLDGRVGDGHVGEIVLGYGADGI